MKSNNLFVVFAFFGRCLYCNLRYCKSSFIRRCTFDCTFCSCACWCRSSYKTILENDFLHGFPDRSKIPDQRTGPNAGGPGIHALLTWFWRHQRWRNIWKPCISWRIHKSMNFSYTWKMQFYLISQHVRFFRNELLHWILHAKSVINKINATKAAIQLSVYRRYK